MIDDFKVFHTDNCQTISMRRWLYRIDFDIQNFTIIKHKDITDSIIYVICNKTDEIAFHIEHITEFDMCLENVKHIINSYIRNRKIEKLST